MAGNASDLSPRRSPMVEEINEPAHKRSKTHHAEVDEAHMDVSEGPAVSEVALSATLGEKLSGSTDIPVLIKLAPPEGTKRTPADICCVIDVSGSMRSEAKIQGDSAAMESQGLSLLDIAKHGLRTIAHTLTPEDRLSIVAFNNSATRVLELTQMDEKGRALADQKIDELTAAGGTDIWKGLLEGLECLRIGGLDRAAHRFGHLMVLTDGETQNRESVLPGLANYSQQHERLPGTICTFGFGYSLNSWLLTQIALVGDGSYSFIPDAGFVGTAFVNTLSNLLATYARSVLMSCDVDSDKAEILGAVGHEMTTDSQGVVRVNLGSLQFGQSKDVVLRMKLTEPHAPSLDVGLRYETNSGEIKTSSNVFEQISTNVEMVESHVLRSRFVEVLKAASEKCTVSSAKDELLVAAQAVQSLSEEAKKSTAASLASVKTLIEDMDGQTTEAFSKMDFFWKWGRHYIPSLMFAHKLEQCNNFKDPGVQLYGGKLFQTIQEEADNIFDSLPPPKPTACTASAGSTPTAPINMADYNNRYSG